MFKNFYLALPCLLYLYVLPAKADTTYFSQCQSATIITPQNESRKESCKVTHFDNGNTMIQLKAGSVHFDFMKMVTTFKKSQNIMKLELFGSRAIGNQICYGSGSNSSDKVLFEVCYVKP